MNMKKNLENSHKVEIFKIAFDNRNSNEFG